MAIEKSNYVCNYSRINHIRLDTIETVIVKASGSFVVPLTFLRLAMMSFTSTGIKQTL